MRFSVNLRAWRPAERQLLLGALLRAAPALGSLWWGLVILRGVLPAVLVVVTGALVGAIEASRPIGGPLTVLAVVFIGIQALSPLHVALSTNLGELTSTWLQRRLYNAAVAPEGIAHLERSELVNDFTLARDFDLGITAPPLSVSLPFVANGLVTLLSGTASAAILFAYRWWAPLVLVGIWVGVHFLLRESTIWRSWRSDEVMEQQRHADYAYRMAVDVPAAKELRIFGLAGWSVERFGRHRRQLLDMAFEALKLRQRGLTGALLIVAAGNLAVFGSIARDAADGRIEIARAIVFVGAAAGTALLGAVEFDWWMDTASRPVPVVSSLEERMPSYASLEAGEAAAAGLPRREIRLRGVTFGYDPANPVFEDLDLTIPAGRSLAVVGANGAGKTTLAKLLCRLYDPQRGVIEVDGADLRSLDLGAWRARVTGVFQDFIRYELPLRENVAPLGAPDEDIAWAVREAGLDVADLRTVMSRSYDGGADLSGGQWQRVALARAMCAVRTGAGVVLLDEPTAQLDARGELEIFEAILAATRGCTTILISHRFSTVRHADLICVLDGGKVAEMGSHDELMALEGRYQTMFSLQAARFAR